MYRFFVAVVFAAFASVGNGAVVLKTFDFSDSSEFSTTPAQFNDNIGAPGDLDYFTLTDGTDIGTSTLITGNTGNFFAAQDHGVGTITFDAINIAGFTDLVFAGFFGEDTATDSNFDWDSTDFFLLEAIIDGGAAQNLIAFESDTSSTTNTPARLDTDFDGVSDISATALTDALALFQANIAGTGNSLVLRATMSFNAGDEDIAFDTFSVSSVTAVPEPASLLALGGVFGAGAFRRIRRQRAAA